MKGGKRSADGSNGNGGNILSDPRVGDTEGRLPARRGGGELIGNIRASGGLAYPRGSLGSSLSRKPMVSKRVELRTPDEVRGCSNGECVCVCCRAVRGATGEYKSWDEGGSERLSCLVGSDMKREGQGDFERGIFMPRLLFVALMLFCLFILSCATRSPCCISTWYTPTVTLWVEFSCAQEEHILELRMSRLTL